MKEGSIYTVTFLRHGESVGNVENRHQGQAEFPLTEKGRSQVIALAERWQSEGITFDRAFTSPLLRARQTAEIVCTTLGIPLEPEPDLMELNNGLPQESMTAYTHYGKTGESRWELFLRAGRVVQKLIDAPPGRTLMVSHGGILSMVMNAILGIPIQPGLTGARFLFHNTTFATFTYDPIRHYWCLLHYDDRRHLIDEEEA
jgi:2,3-bisphosphoglycerate-dependent phosphoglycerate mutase